MSGAVATLPRLAEPDVRLAQDLRVSLLAALLVEFDPMLAAELHDHLEAKASSWVGGPNGTSARRAELAERYLALGESIESLVPRI